MARRSRWRSCPASSTRSWRFARRRAGQARPEPRAASPEAPSEPEDQPAAELAPSAGASSHVPSPGASQSFADAAAALAAAAAYFSRNEPSSPALLLVRQAEQLVGKSFLELIRILVPAHAEQAKVQIGKDRLHAPARAGRTADGGSRRHQTSSARHPPETILWQNDNGMAPAVEASTRQEAVTCSTRSVIFTGQSSRPARSRCSRTARAASLSVILWDC